MRCSNCENKEKCLDAQEIKGLCGCSSGIPRRKNPTNADRIRSMTDEELAEFIFSQVSAKCNNHDCVGADTCYYHADWNSGECDGCDKAILRWLQKDSEV